MKKVNELKDYTKQFILKRYMTKEFLEKELSKFLGFDFTFEKHDYDDSPDYSMIATLKLDDDKAFYLDFFYLIDRENDLCILEFSFDSDNGLDSDDLDKKIKKGGY